MSRDQLARLEARVLALEGIVMALSIDRSVPPPAEPVESYTGGPRVVKTATRGEILATLRERVAIEEAAQDLARVGELDTEEARRIAAAVVAEFGLKQTKAGGGS